MTHGVRIVAIFLFTHDIELGVLTLPKVLLLSPCFGVLSDKKSDMLGTPAAKRFFQGPKSDMGIECPECSGDQWRVVYTEP